MTKQQAVALHCHCRLGCETAHPRFASFGPGQAYSIVLSVNTGYE